MSNLVSKMLNFVGFETEEDYEEDYYENEVEEADDVYEESPAADRMASRRSSRMVRLHDASVQMRMVVIRPQNFEDAREITNHLKDRRPIVMNLEALDKNVARRVVDFLSGAVYALDGDIQKVSNGIFLVAPKTVGIIGDEMKSLHAAMNWEN